MEPVETLEEADAPEAKFSPEEEAFARKLLSTVTEREESFKSEKGWWKDAEKAVDIYDAVDEKTPFNILYSNTEVLLPSIFSASPKPDVRPRFNKQQLGPLVEVLNRFLTVAADNGTPGAETLEMALQDSVLSALTAGAGYVRIRQVENAAFPIKFESVYYKNFLWAKGRKWEKLPWIAFKHEMTKEAFAKQFGIGEDALAENYTIPEQVEDDDDSKRSDCCVYEVWYAPTKTVYFLCDRWKGVLAEKSPDPLGLAQFFPVPGILSFTKKPGNLIPTTLYRYYQQQAEELNRVSTRLNKVLAAIRVRGAYNNLLGEELKNILSTDVDNGLVPAQNSAALGQMGGFDKNIWLLPIDMLIQVAAELYKAREAIKQVIYELTGISDIIRGSSVASETATAQDLKSKWGTVRLRKMQGMAANYSRDLFRLAVDAASQAVPPEQWKEITQIPLPTAEEKAVAQKQLQYSQMVAMQTGQQPQIDPKLQEAAQAPSWEEVLAQIKSDLDRTYVVNIQTSSTIDIDTAAEKQEVAEFMNALGQFFSGVQPLMMIGPQGFEIMKQMLAAFASRFKFGVPLLDAIQAIQPPPPPQPEAPPPDPELPAKQAAAEAKVQQIQMDMQVAQAKQQLELEKLQMEREKLQIEREKMQIDIQKSRMQLQAMQAKAAMAPVQEKTKNAAVPN